MIEEFTTAQTVLWLTCALFFTMGGFVKGTMGVGLPLVVVPTLSLLIPAPQAMGLLVVPVLVSNLWQAVEGGNVRYSIRRFASLILVQMVITLLTVKFSSGLSVGHLNLLIGISFKFIWQRLLADVNLYVFNFININEQLFVVATYRAI